ncbi:MAG TPA: ABC transporter substrate-binding protein [Pyrinomonadaceae bacterium]|nr:ABC transporter substrate-binding protein [Pyrinomonadaceae bacterium]
MSKVLSLVLALFLIFPSACSRRNAPAVNANNNTGNIKVGVFLSLTGATAAYGSSALNSFKLATEEVNSGGGIGGRQVELIVEDDHSNIGEVAGIVTKLITQDKVHALLAEPISTRAMVAAPIAQEHKVVMISPAAVKPELTMRGPYIFRACFISPAEGEAIAKFASERLKAKRAAVILDGKNDYAVVLAGFFSEHFKKLGGEIVNEQNYEASDREVAAKIKAINAAKPDVIFAPGFYSTAALVAREVKRQNVKAILIGSDGWDSPSLLEGAGDAFEGVYFANHFWVGGNDPVVRKFVADYQAKFGSAPDAGAATAYDAAHLLFDAIKRAGSSDSIVVRDALAKTADFPGVTGRITIDANRNALVPVYMLRIEKGGKFSLQSGV